MKKAIVLISIVFIVVFAVFAENVNQTITLSSIVLPQENYAFVLGVNPVGNSPGNGWGYGWGNYMWVNTPEGKLNVLLTDNQVALGGNCYFAIKTGFNLSFNEPQPPVNLRITTTGWRLEEGQTNTEQNYNEITLCYFTPYNPNGNHYGNRNCCVDLAGDGCGFVVTFFSGVTKANELIGIFVASWSAIDTLIPGNYVGPITMTYTTT